MSVARSTSNAHKIKNRWTIFTKLSNLVDITIISICIKKNSGSLAFFYPKPASVNFFSACSKGFPEQKTPRSEKKNTKCCSNSAKFSQLMTNNIIYISAEKNFKDLPFCLRIFRDFCDSVSSLAGFAECHGSVS